MHRALLAARDYESQVRATNPVFYAPLQGSTIWEVEQNARATVSGTAPLYANGPFGGANSYRFSASTADDDMFTVPTHASYHPGDVMSFGGWVNQMGAGGSFPVILTANTAFDYYLGTDATGHYIFAPSGSAALFTTTTAYLNTGWHHVIFTKNAQDSAIICYVDGVSVAGSGNEAQSILVGSADIEIGNAAAFSGDFDGQLAHLAVWARVLSANDVAGLSRF